MFCSKASKSLWPISHNLKQSNLLAKPSSIIQRHLSALPDKENQVYGNKDTLMDNLGLIGQSVKRTYDYSVIPQAYDIVLEKTSYISTGGKMWRPCSFLCTYKMLEKPENLTDENLNLAYIYAWCIEIVHGVGALLDDIQKETTMRRNKKNFLRSANFDVQSLAQNVDFLANEVVFENFKNHPALDNLIEMLCWARFRMYSGLVYEPLMVDFSTKRPIFSSFTMNNYSKLTKYKYGYNGINFPIQAALSLANQYDPKKIENSSSVLDKLATVYHMRADLDDLLTNTVQKEITDNMENHIANSSMSWFAIRTMELADADQRMIWQQHYGRKKKDSILKVLNVYKELELEKLFKDEENRLCRVIKADIPKVQFGLPRDVLYAIAEGLLKVKLRN